MLAELQTSGTIFRSAPEDVLEYAVYLGMQLDEEKELLWIADQALQAEDPEGWSQCESPNGDLYYVNQAAPATPLAPGPGPRLKPKAWP